MAALAVASGETIGLLVGRTRPSAWTWWSQHPLLLVHQVAACLLARRVGCPCWPSCRRGRRGAGYLARRAWIRARLSGELDTIRGYAVTDSEVDAGRGVSVPIFQRATRPSPRSRDDAARARRSAPQALIDMTVGAARRISLSCSALSARPDTVMPEYRPDRP